MMLLTGICDFLPNFLQPHDTYMKLSKPSLLLSLFLPVFCLAQDLSGVWEGQSNMGPMRMVLVQKGDSCFGYVFESSMGKCTAHFEGKFDATKKELTGSNPGFIRKDFGHGLASYTLGYDSSGGKEILTGKARPKSTAAQIFSFGMTLQCNFIRTGKVPDTTGFMAARLNRLQPDPVVFAVQADDNPPKPDTLLTTRPSEVLHTISATAGVIKCTLYDNGVYDHDTVTVIHNGRVIINAAEISGKPLKFEIHLSKEEPVHEIVFYANNLGEIPPNTGLLLIDTVEKRHELDFKADKNTNGKVILRLRE